MTREELTAAALSIRSYLHENFGSSSKGRGYIEHNLNYGMGLYPREWRAPFENYLAEKISTPDEMWLSTGTSGGTVQIYHLASAMLERLIEDDDIDAIINDVHDLLDRRLGRTETVVGIVGISIDHPIEVEKDVWLVRNTDVPATIQREQLFKINRWNEPINHSRGFSIERPPTAAVIFHHPETEIFGREKIMSDASASETAKRIYETVRRVCAAACISCASSPFPSWTYSHACHPAVGYGNLGSSGGSGTFHPTVFRFANLEASDFSQCYKMLFNFKSGYKNIILALDRLSLSRARHTPIDKAIDLGIALEVTLLNQIKEGELSYRLRTRGAWFLGRDFDERDKVSKLLNKLYTLRSQAAHNGEFSESFTKDGKALQILKEGDEMCAQIIRRIVESGKFPDWDSLSLGQA